MATMAEIVGKWTCKAGAIHMTFEFVNDGTYKYINHGTGVTTNARYSVESDTIQMIADNSASYKYVLQDDELTITPIANGNPAHAHTLTFRRVQN